MRFFRRQLRMSFRVAFAGIFIVLFPEISFGEKACLDRDWLFRIPTVGAKVQTLTVGRVRDYATRQREFVSLIQGGNAGRLASLNLKMSCQEAIAAAQPMVEAIILEEVALQGINADSKELEAELDAYDRMIDRKIRVLRFAEQWAKPMILISESELGAMKAQVEKNMPSAITSLSSKDLRLLLLERATMTKMTARVQKLAEHYHEENEVSRQDNGKTYQIKSPQGRKLSFSELELRDGFNRLFEFQLLLIPSPIKRKEAEKNIDKAKVNEDLFKDYVRSHLLESLIIERGYNYPGTYREKELKEAISGYRRILKSSIVLSRYTKAIIAPRVRVGPEDALRAYSEIQKLPDYPEACKRFQGGCEAAKRIREECNKSGEKQCKENLKEMLYMQSVLQLQQQRAQEALGERRIKRNPRFYPA